MNLFGAPERDDPPPLRRRGKEVRERIAAAVLLVPAAPLLAVGAAAIKLEGLLDREGRGPVFFVEDRVSRGRVIALLKFRTLQASALAGLGAGPTHIKHLERSGHTTRVGEWLRRWYLDELPQLVNIVRGDMFFIGTRPYPVDAYEEEIARGVVRKRDMPGGLVGPVQSHKGVGSADELDLDLEYWEAFCTWPAWRLMRLDLEILWRSLRVQLAHQGL